MSLPMASSTSASNTPESDSRGSTPGSRSVTTTPSGKGSNKTKPVNVFSNDGSFLERFQRIKKEDEEKKKREEEIALKRNFDQRFKSRGKRRAPSEPATEPDDTTAKKAKTEPEKLLTAYEKELKTYSGSLKDVGTGVRPLVK